MIAIVDYGVGNLYSLQSSLRQIGADCVVTCDPAVLASAHQLILPGVGAFADAREKLAHHGLDQAVVEQAKAGKPLLGICLGMQLLYEGSCEYGHHPGLGLIGGQIRSMADALHAEGLKVPHMGWNDLVLRRNSPLLQHSGEGDYVYYVHSYYAPVTADTTAYSRYGSVRMTGTVQRDNVYGCQFHPEKSGAAGLNILRAFAEIGRKSQWNYFQPLT